MTSPDSILNELELDLQLCASLADRADAITRERFRSSDLQVETKPDLSPVTEADKSVERQLRSAIEAARPGDRIIGEEYGGLAEDGLPDGRVWIIDPIDGTKNFVRGVPVWATLIGLVVDGEPTVGYVSAPALGKRWWAATGCGAWSSTTISGFDPTPTRIQVSAVSDMNDASLSLSDREYWPGISDNGWQQLSESVWRVRAFGDFYSHMLVAEGSVDVAPEAALNMWDVAALIPIITEAGGRISGFDGSDALTAGNAMTTNGLLHQSALDLL